EWDNELLRFFGIPRCILPKVMPSSGIFGFSDAKFFGSEIPISGIAGDQQSALFGQGCIETGDVKNTYGTGAFLLMNTGNRPVASRSGLLTTVAWQIGSETTYALEGSVFVCGSVIQWLRDELKIIDSASETEKIAKSVASTDGVYLVPAFVGLGAPYWDPYARGALLGVSRGTSRAHIVRAALEGIAFETCDVLSSMENDVGVRIHSLAVDGGASANNFLMQTQADFAGVKILRPVCTESTALGAAMLAALGVGIYSSPSEIAAHHKIEREFAPEITTEARELALSGWHDTVSRVLKR
ncbi:MAG: glycerol kinase, partial [Firmicutes bacterium]|nr:glycerol kinase [Bacillota bacterium]